MLVSFWKNTVNTPTRLKPLFHPGRLLVTPVALDALRANGIPLISVMLKHITGDWGNVSDDDRHQNDLSIAAGLRLLSIYRLPDGARIIVVTEWDRSSTTVERMDDEVNQRSTTQAHDAITRPFRRYAPRHCRAD